jgi:hypothetical protein
MPGPQPFRRTIRAPTGSFAHRCSGSGSGSGSAPQTGVVIRTHPAAMTEPCRLLVQRGVGDGEKVEGLQQRGQCGGSRSAVAEAPSPQRSLRRPAERLATRPSVHPPARPPFHSSLLCFPRRARARPLCRLSLTHSLLGSAADPVAATAAVRLLARRTQRNARPRNTGRARRSPAGGEREERRQGREGP